MGLGETIARLSAEFKDYEFFAVHGSTEDDQLVEQVEQELGVKLPADVANFARTYGGIYFDPTFFVTFAPDSDYDGCIEWTATLRSRYAHMPRALVALLKDERVYYLLDTVTGRVYGWEMSNASVLTSAFAQFASLEEFILYLAEQARQTAG